MFPGDSDSSETLDQCLECMHAEEICVIPYDSDDPDQEINVTSESDAQCEIELLSFCKVDVHDLYANMP